MGIGNEDGVPCVADPFELITPHGDREHLCAGRGRTALPAHYPSWGSGTNTVLAGAERRRELITPHGDRELEPGDDVVVAGAQLITPHGDRERRSWLCSRFRFSCSLPLMGIGNGCADRPKPEAKHPHYPSWGSGTPYGGRFRRNARISHYPSWGSGTQKSSVLEAAIRDSLPLMGIGNSIKDHVPSEIPCSLPLMGIGNPARERASA